LQVAALEVITELRVQDKAIMPLEAVVLEVYTLRRDQSSVRDLIQFLLVLAGQIKHLIQLHHQMASVPMELTLLQWANEPMVVVEVETHLKLATLEVLVVVVVAPVHQVMVELEIDKLETVHLIPHLELFQHHYNHKDILAARDMMLDLPPKDFLAVVVELVELDRLDSQMVVQEVLVVLERVLIGFQQTMEHLGLMVQQDILVEEVEQHHNTQELRQHRVDMVVEEQEIITLEMIVMLLLELPTPEEVVVPNPIKMMVQEEDIMVPVAQDFLPSDLRALDDTSS
jgi:hypothetical protein